ncbi:MAG: methionine--tRNA ligase [Nitrospinaceae bacterium]|nr:methionine--tRNA ligase [Nitrospinaceae bacterium]NIR55963.1 methionine--tRNA ligase [Nitrospinaceae bacterium]NIS86406.1 methionine--tRNA ligase [Nitrospinaceae bacterium]NIT83244.1 methionine--tRNA ligase [Nitrospinaceae bacterium]NIU45451.1 methionine--tRNA ligase [Nitrospinaceae bacterium]
MNKKFFITTPIYYVNDVPHIGHAYTTIAADVVARYKRLAGYEVFFLTGTDEHGQKVQQAAGLSGREPQAHVDDLHVRFKELWVRFNISNNDFIRTTEERHKKVVCEILQKLYDEGEIYKDSYEGWYCMPDERFWTEKDLIDGNCPECGRPVDKIKEFNYFFKMGKYRDWLVEHIQNHENFIQPKSRRNEILGFLKNPLDDLCISRPKERLPWGIPLPFDDDYVTYVWFDALINYISVHGHLQQIKDSGFWPATHQLIGKDILTTHSVYWATMLKAAGLDLPHNIFAHGWWTINGQKMSKSLRNVVEPNHLIDQFGVDVIRYFLLREVPFGLDGDFSHKALIGRINSDLANNLGNLLNRTLNMLKKYFKSELPSIDAKGEEDGPMIDKSREVTGAIDQLYDELAYSKILTKLWEFLDAANVYINDTAPWNLAKTDDGKKRLATVLYNAAEACRVIAVLIAPFMPETADKMMKQLGIDTPVEKQGLDSLKEWGWIQPGTRTHQGPQIFPRIDDKAAAKILKEVNIGGEAPSPEKKAEGDGNGQITIDDFMKIDLRTAKILEAEKVKKSKKLIKLKVDLGSEQRQVLAGIAEAYEPEQLVGRTVILVANLKPAKLMGLESQGMILAGSDDKTILLGGFDGDLPPGVRVK